jgi:pimeloyl-ACP methyl ester carboxylesterase
MEPTVRHLTVDDVPMRWIEVEQRRASGSALPPVVLLHGIPTSPLLWRRVLPLIDGLTLAWEMVGYGDSIPAGRSRDISVARQARYLESWLDALDPGPVVLVGHDLGGGVAQILAVRRPDRCAGLVLTNCVAEDAWPVWPVRLMRSLDRPLRWLPDPLVRQIFVRLLTWMHADRTVGREAAARHWAPYARHGGLSALVRQARALDSSDTASITHALARLDLPARVLWGMDDPFLPLDLGARLAARLGTSLRPLPGCRHFTPEDAPRGLAEAIAELRNT